MFHDDIMKALSRFRFVRTRYDPMAAKLDPYLDEFVFPIEYLDLDVSAGDGRWYHFFGEKCIDGYENVAAQDEPARFPVSSS